MNDAPETTWNDTDTEIFIKYGQCFVPERERQLNIVSDLLPLDKPICNVVDICSGEGLLSEAILKRNPKARIHLLDASEQMLEKAKTRLKHYESQVSTKIIDIHDLEWRKFDRKIDAFVSSLAIHHLDCEEKKVLYKNLYEQLNQGGVFVNADLIMPETQIGLNIAGKMWDEETKKRSLDIEGDLSAYQAFEKHRWNYFYEPDDPVDKPSPLFKQLKWLEDAGFKNIDIYWLVAGHAIYAGYKI